MENFITTKVVRCEPYPLVEPHGYVTGFIFTCNANGKSVYRDTFITFTDIFSAVRGATNNYAAALDAAALMDTTQIVLDIAYQKLYGVIEGWLRVVSHSPPLMGMAYHPPPLPPPPVPPPTPPPSPAAPFNGFQTPAAQFDPRYGYNPTEGEYDGEEYSCSSCPAAQQPSEPSVSFPPFYHKGVTSILETSPSVRPIKIKEEEDGTINLVD